MTPSSARPSNLKQAPWGLLDQGVSAGTNVGLSLAVAATVSAREFGAFSLVYVLYTVLLGLVRTTGTDVLAIQHAASPSTLRNASREATGYALTVGAVAGAGCLLVASSGLGHDRDLLVVLGVGLPVLLLQDAWRGVLLAMGSPRRALVNDVVWAVVQFSALAALWTVLGSLPVAGFVAVWVAGAAAGAVTGLLQTGLVPLPQPPHRWLRRNRALALPLLVTELLIQLPVQLTYLLMPLFSSLSQLGVLRASYLLFGPIGLICQSIGALALPDAARATGRPAVHALAKRVSLVLALVAVSWSLLVMALPEGLGRTLLGASWSPDPDVRLLLAVSLVAEAVLVGARVALAAWRLPRKLMRGRLVSAPVLLVGGLGLAHRFGAAGLAGGLALAYALAAAVSWREVAHARTSVEPRVLPTDPAVVTCA